MHQLVIRGFSIVDARCNHDVVDTLVVFLTTILCILVYLSSNIHNKDDTPKTHEAFPYQHPVQLQRPFLLKRECVPLVRFTHSDEKRITNAN